MMFDVTFDEQNTDFDVSFKNGGVNIKNTELQKDIYPNVVRIKKYVIDMDTLKNNNFMITDVDVTSSSGSYKLTTNITFIVASIEGAVVHKIVDIPFEFMNNSGVIWVNQYDFKKVGMKSQTFTSIFGTSTIWFDTIEKLLKNNNFRNITTSFECSSRYSDLACLTFTLSAECGSINIVNYMKDLFEQTFSISGNKLVLEYQSQENIEDIEAKYLYDDVPATALLSNLDIQN